jgi:hypothetical protein
MKYLNNNFLGTATCRKVNNRVSKISYMKFDNHVLEDSALVSPNIEMKSIDCQELYLQKTNNECLENELSSMLYNKYILLASQNDAKNNIPSKLNKFWYSIKKYIYGNNDVILYEENSYKELWQNIRNLCNIIRLTNRTQNQNFIVINEELFGKLMNKSIMSNNFIRENNTKNNNIKLMCTVENIEIYVNNNAKNDNILIGTKTIDDNLGVHIMEQNLEINNKTIIWCGAIDNISNNDSKLFNTLNVIELNNLSNFKRILYKLFKKFL